MFSKKDRSNHSKDTWTRLWIGPYIIESQENPVARMKVESFFGTSKASLNTINVKAGEGLEPVIRFPQSHEDLFWSLSKATGLLFNIEDDIKSYIVFSTFQLTF